VRGERRGEGGETTPSAAHRDWGLAYGIKRGKTKPGKGNGGGTFGADTTQWGHGGGTTVPVGRGEREGRKV